MSAERYRYLWCAVIVATVASWPVFGFGRGEQLTVLVELAWLVLLRHPPAKRRAATR